MFVFRSVHGVVGLGHTLASCGSVALFTLLGRLEAQIFRKCCGAHFEENMDKTGQN